MQNFVLLTEVGQTQKPVLLKRGMSATIVDLLMSAEYILSQGNPNVVLCERGVKSFDPATRNLFDVAAVPACKALSHLPIIVDPSHATGPARSDSRLCAGRRRGRRRRRTHRSPQLPRRGHVRRPAGAAARAIRRAGRPDSRAGRAVGKDDFATPARSDPMRRPFDCRQLEDEPRSGGSGGPGRGGGRARGGRSGSIWPCSRPASISTPCRAAAGRFAWRYGAQNMYFEPNGAFTGEIERRDAPSTSAAAT